MIAADTAGRDRGARRLQPRRSPTIPPLYDRTAQHYAQLLDRTLRLTTPDARLNRAYDWARVGMDKGLATNPALGTGLVAGFRTSGNSERPGLRVVLWPRRTLDGAGAHRRRQLRGTARTALDFLATLPA